MCRVLLPLLLLLTAAAAPPVAGTWEGEAASDLWPTFLRIEIGPGEHAPATLFVLGQTIDLGKTKDAASLDSVLGDGGDALTVTGHVESDHLVGTLKQSGKTFAFRLQRVPTYAPTRDRVVGWSRDLDALRDRLLTFDRSFDAAEKRAARAAIEQLRAELPSLSDDEVLVRIARITTLANNAHTRLYFLRNRTEVRRMPIRVWWFSPELRVVRAAPGYRQLLGCRIDKVGSLTVSTAKARVSGLFAGSPDWRTYMSSYSLTSPEVLHGTGIIASSDAPVGYSFSGCGAASGQKSISALPLAKSAKPLESWWDLSPHYPGAADDWIQVLQDKGGALPLYQRHPEKNYWFDPKAPGGIFYIQYNRAADAPDEDMAGFASRVRQALANQPPPAVVVDLRFNTGGNGNLTTKLVDALKKVSPATPFYVITGRATFSAGIVAAAQLRELRRVKIVGEPVGDGLDFWAEGGNIILPYSGLYVHFANGAHSLSPKPCPTRDYCDDLSVTSLTPDIPAQLTWAAYRALRDPAMEAVGADLRGKRKVNVSRRAR